MEKDFFIEQSDFLSKLESSLCIDPVDSEYGLVELEYGFPKEQLEQIGFVIPAIPEIDFSDFATKLDKLPDFEYALLPRWRTADIPIMICVGFLGALISLGLHDFFDELHRNWGGNTYENGGHGGQVIDKIRGAKHRYKYGHDLFNPFEIEWDNYFPDGTNASLLTKVCAWLKHLMQDTFSTEGLPIPGSSYFRDVIDKFCKGISVLDGVDKYDAYKTFFTIKARDAVGTAFIAGAMSLYVYGTDKSSERKFFNYRYTSLTLGALIINICVGLSMAPKKASMNHFSVICTIPYIITLVKVNNKVNQQIKQRNLTILQNQDTVRANKRIILENESKLQSYNNKLDELLEKITGYYNSTSCIINSSIEECIILISEQEVWLSQLEAELNISNEV